MKPREKNNKCKELNCTVIWRFGILGQKAEYCDTHKKEEMVNVIDKSRAKIKPELTQTNIKCIYINEFSEECKDYSINEYFGLCGAHYQKNSWKCAWLGCDT